LLPRVLCLRLRLRLMRNGVPSLVAAQQWRATIKAGLESIAPGALSALFDPEHAGNPSAKRRAPGLETKAGGSNSATPGFALYARDIVDADANQALYLTFFENAARYVPLVLQAVLQRHSAGVGARSDPFELTGVELFRQGHGWTPVPSVGVTSDATLELIPVPFATPAAAGLPVHTVPTVVVRLQSRTVLRSRGEPLASIHQWSEIGEALIRRASQIRAAWGNPGDADAELRWQVTCRDLRVLSSELRLVDSTIRADHGTLSSGRQHTRYTSAGLVGTTVWEGSAEAVGAWMPLLRFGEIAQIGQQTTVGMGRIQITV